MIHITERAGKAILDALEEERHDPEQTFLRVGVQGGGCSGLSYKLEFDASLREGDEMFRAGDAKVVVDPKSMLFLHGLTLDHTSGLNGKGFVFENPNASGTCGCGQSFKV